MADETPSARRARRAGDLFWAFLGYMLGRIVQRLVGNKLDPVPPLEPLAEGDRTGFLGGGASIIDDAVTIGGALLAGYQATRGGKRANLYAGMAIGLGSPIADALVDRATSMLGGVLGGGE